MKKFISQRIVFSILAFILFCFSGCVVKEYPHEYHRHCHERVYVEQPPVVEEKVVVQ